MVQVVVSCLALGSSQGQLSCLPIIFFFRADAPWLTVTVHPLLRFLAVERSWGSDAYGTPTLKWPKISGHIKFSLLNPAVHASVYGNSKTIIREGLRGGTCTTYWRIVGFPFLPHLGGTFLCSAMSSQTNAFLCFIYPESHRLAYMPQSGLELDLIFW